MRNGLLALAMCLLSCGPSTTFEPTNPQLIGSVSDAGAADAGQADAGIDAGFDAGQSSIDAGSGIGVATANPAGVITAPSRTWSWLEVPESSCGDGRPTGIGINLAANSNDVFVYLMGGGACWDLVTCSPSLLGAATYVTTGYQRAEFTTEIRVIGQQALFNRNNAQNQFKDATYVFIPYCTGDVHVGDKDSTYSGFGQSLTVSHKGRVNVEEAIKRIKATLPNAQRVFVAGSSAGAYGAQINFPAFKAAYPSAEVHMLADCGQLIQPTGQLLSNWSASWNLQGPSDCMNCTTDFSAYVDYLSTKYPTSRFSLLAYDEDNVLKGFFGYLNDVAGFKAATRALLANKYVGKTNMKYFLVPNVAAHVMLGDTATIMGPGNVQLLSWLNAFTSNTAQWVNVGP